MSLSDPTVTVPLEALCCPDCGALFAVPEIFLRQKDGDDITCPNGHQNCWPRQDDDDAKDSPKVKDLRRELVHAMHRAEQAEARTADNGEAPADAIASVEAFPTLCPCGNCLRTFKLARVLFNHLVRDHAMPPAQAEQVSTWHDAPKGASATPRKGAEHGE
jgi:hypothetical protein